MRKTKKTKAFSVGDKVILKLPQCKDDEMIVVNILVGGKTLVLRKENSASNTPDFYASPEVCKKL